jgi:hypothetical protein
MADVRERILDDMETILLATDGINYQGIGDILPDPKRMPQVAIIPMLETTEPSGTDPEIHFETLQVRIRTLVDQAHESAGKELERILGVVQRALLADPRRGGLASATRKTGTNWLFLDPEHPQAGADLLLSIDYYSAAKNPAQQIV